MRSSSTTRRWQRIVGQPSWRIERLGELLEGVRQDHDLGALGAARRGTSTAPGQRLEAADHVLDARQREAVLVEQVEPVAHEDVVVGLVAGGAAQRVDAGALGDGDPDLRDEDALEVEGDDRLLRVRSVGGGELHLRRCRWRRRRGRRRSA